MPFPTMVRDFIHSMEQEGMVFVNYFCLQDMAVSTNSDMCIFHLKADIKSLPSRIVPWEKLRS